MWLSLRPREEVGIRMGSQRRACSSGSGKRRAGFLDIPARLYRVCWQGEE